MMRRTKRFFGNDDGAKLLKAIGECRSAVIVAMTVAPIGGDVYRRCGPLLTAIDHLAEVLAGKRTHFHEKPAGGS
jgi:hypothetical protein